MKYICRTFIFGGSNNIKCKVTEYSNKEVNNLTQFYGKKALMITAHAATVVI